MPSPYENYAYCRNCGWVRAGEATHCPMCGLKLRHKPRRKKAVIWHVYHKAVQERT